MSDDDDAGWPEAYELVKSERIGHSRAVFARLNPVAMRAHARKKFFYSQ